MQQIRYAKPDLMKPIFAFLCAMSLAGVAMADSPVVDAVELAQSGMDWRVSVTVSHPDTGWDHYADGWEVLDETGKRLGFRELMHPHVNEQPFTRSLGRVYIPDGTTRIYIRTRCSQHGWTEEAVEVAVDR